MTYRDAVLKLKSQCRQKKHYKYLAPLLISNLHGPLGDEALTMELEEYLAPDGVEKYLNFLKERLNIQKLDMATYGFQKYLREMMGRKR